jgi:hypothetical protein
MHEVTLIDTIESLCHQRGFPVARDVKVGPYLAPLVVCANDAAGLGREIKIAVEPRHWDRAVAGRMLRWATQHIQRLKKLTEVDFVTIAVAGDQPARGDLTSVVEFAEFLDGFEPPSSSSEPRSGAARTRGYPQPTRKYEDETTGMLQSWTGGGIVFCAMPFADQFDAVFYDLMLPAVSQADLIASRTDHEATLESIDKRIVQGIRKADVVLADMTGHNPNVMYEIGVSHAAGKPTLLLRQDTLAAPFDIRYHEIMDYSNADFRGAAERLASRLREGVRALWEALGE